MKAITVRFLGHTEHKPSRLIASDMDGKRLVVSWNAATDGNPERPYLFAAQQLCKKMGWTGRLIEGGIKGGSVFVFADKES